MRKALRSSISREPTPRANRTSCSSVSETEMPPPLHRPPPVSPRMVIVRLRIQPMPRSMDGWLVRPHDQHRLLGAANNPFGHAANNQMRQAFAAMGSEHDQVRVHLARI